MSDAAEATGAPTPITVAGKEYTCEPLTVRGWGEIHSRIKAQRRSALATAAADLDKFDDAETKRLVIREAVNAKTSITPDDVSDYLQTPDGLACFFWLMVRRRHPEVATFDKAAELVADEDMAKLANALADASGFAAAKNSSGGQKGKVTETRAFASAN